MRKYLLAAVAAAAIASPAAARDGSGYVGIEGGVLFPQKQDIDGEVDFTTNTVTRVDLLSDDIARVKLKTGYDVDIIGGYDFGMFRLEGELGYKRSKIKSVSIDDAFVTAINTGSGNVFIDDDFNISNRATVLSGMLNGLLDLGGNGGVGAYVGGGIGYASVKEFGDKDSAMAWQLIAGVYMPISDNIDLGLKYRLFPHRQAVQSNTYESVNTRRQLAIADCCRVGAGSPRASRCSTNGWQRIAPWPKMIIERVRMFAPSTVMPIGTAW